MNRFLRIHIAKSDASLSGLAKIAQESSLNRERGKGFEIEILTRKRLLLRWCERVVISRRVDGGVFGIATFEEIKIVQFGLFFDGSTTNATLIDPPVGKEYAHGVLRQLFPAGSFVIDAIDLRKTITEWRDKRKAVLVGIETDVANVAPNITMSVKATGQDDIVKYIDRLHSERQWELKMVHFDFSTKRHSALRVSVGSSGVVRFGEDVNFDTLSEIAESVIYREEM